jgi:hypothetical protein
VAGPSRTVLRCLDLPAVRPHNGGRLKHGSWLDLAECELSVLSSQCLDRRIPDQETLIKEVAAWQNERNKKYAKADWQFTTADARAKLKRLYPTL